ncbi:DUF131 domain-containing protein [Metallosphaera tengchongensis]|uniref:DUF131 domain-containing protein n=1 Tax=Metallosphaera tengchongensis TaxID=1532350 RepID=A0A6N0NV04_9CREN|nr:DUF131 domain-containing protein [Metallosphaera tengchongensis]QKQ99672.1 DUF131 domain-containing protein [Metallosphaera tengchongensis]
MSLIGIGILLIFVGFILIFLDIIVTMARSVRSREETEEEKQTEKREAGGIIFIGPIPIIFGTSKNIEKWMIIVALAITVILVALFLIQFI